MSDPRLLATQILTGVMREGCSLSASIATGLSVLEDSRDRALVQELAYGVLRWLPELDQVLIQLLQRPFKSKDTDLRVLLLIGLYQLIHLRTPAHAAVSTTVAASRALTKP